MSVPDIIYDWAASIDEPNAINHAHTATDHLDLVTKVIPGKYDDIVGHGVKIIGNADDATSSMGIDIYEKLFNYNK
jgi:hypothetical protein